MSSSTAAAAKSITTRFHKWPGNASDTASAAKESNIGDNSTSQIQDSVGNETSQRQQIIISSSTEYHSDTNHDIVLYRRRVGMEQEDTNGNQNDAIRSEPVSLQQRDHESNLRHLYRLNENKSDNNSQETLRPQIVIFIHGAGGCAEQFWNLMHVSSSCASLYHSENKYPNMMYSYDWYGHRESFQSSQNDWDEYSAFKLEEDLDFVIGKCLKEYWEYCDHVVPNVVLVAHSYGTGLLIRLLRRKLESYRRTPEETEADDSNSGDKSSLEQQSLNYMDHISKIALISTTDACPKVAQSALWRMPVFLVEWIRPLLSRLNSGLMYHESTPQETVNYWKSIASTNSIAMMKALCRQMEWFTPSDASYIKKKMPNWKFYVLCGKHDRVTDPRDAKNVADACEANYRVFEDSSHNLMVEKPEEIMEFIMTQ